MNKLIFGNSESAKILAEIVEKNPTHRKKITSIMNEYNTVQWEIVNSDLSIKLKKNFLRVTLDRFKLKMHRFDGGLRTFGLNVIRQIYRKHLKSLS